MDFLPQAAGRPRNPRAEAPLWRRREMVLFSWRVEILIEAIERSLDHSSSREDLREHCLMLDHLSIQCDDVAASAAFYDTVLAPLGGQRILDFGTVIGYGVPPMPDLWLGPHTTGEGFRESHIAFSAPSRAAVDAFLAAARAAGSEVLHEARVWPEYHPNYYGAFVRDPDGNNVEAVCHSPE